MAIGRVNVDTSNIYTRKTEDRIFWGKNNVNILKIEKPFQSVTIYPYAQSSIRDRIFEFSYPNTSRDTNQIFIAINGIEIFSYYDRNNSTELYINPLNIIASKISDTSMIITVVYEKRDQNITESIFRKNFVTSYSDLVITGGIKDGGTDDLRTRLEYECYTIK
ncbi:hypothetical protein [Clostridium senegalense]|uniref:hypothetical protein n=1 Tax=Clostridium senegalense TaxID=1465809 RepID=UPI0002893986|nr:hypothetical protein [Clostridium senegalense]